MSRKKTHLYNGEFKSDNEMIEMFKIYNKEIWKDRGNNLDIVRTRTIYTNGEEIRLLSNVFLLNKLIIICAVICGYEYISLKKLSESHISKVVFLDNSEKKGATIFFTIPSRSF
uniref:Uncharacterized protein n=1 Tax=Strongyloides venezuelensis TaxID=75913 RepID=A0A0K0FYE2_STRVS